MKRIAKIKHSYFLMKLFLKVITVFCIVVNSTYVEAVSWMWFQTRNNYVTVDMLSDFGAINDQILRFNGSNWVGADYETSLIYAGNWDASTNVPDLDDVTDKIGKYFIVTTSGDGNDLVNTTESNWKAGDWAIWNNSDPANEFWEKVVNSTFVLSLFGRTGEIIPQAGDYTWDQVNTHSMRIYDFADVEVPHSPNDEDALAWNEDILKWDNVDISFKENSITSYELGDGIIGSEKIVNKSLNDSNFNFNSIHYSNLNFNYEEIPYRKISGLEATLSTTIPTSGGSMFGDIDLDNNKIENALAVDGVIFDTLIFMVGENSFDVASVTEKLTATFPLHSTGVPNPQISMTMATDSTDGYLSSLDWNTFNDKQIYITIDATLAAKSVTTSSEGGIVIGPYLDGTTKTGEIRFLETGGSDFVAIKSAATLGANIILTLPGTEGGAGHAIAVDSDQNLYWNDIADVNDVVTEITVEHPITSAGGLSPTLGISLACVTESGYVSLTDWNIFNNKQNAIDRNTDLLMKSLTTNSQNGLKISPYYDGSSKAGQIQFLDLDEDNYVVLKAPSSATDTVWVLPATDGTVDQTLTTNGDKTLTWTTVLRDNLITGTILSDMEASPGHLLQWNGSSWGPVALSRLHYIDGWDASGAAPAVPSGGGYYIVTTAGDVDLGGGPGTDDYWSVGDWAIYNGESDRWEKINNNNKMIMSLTAATPMIASVSDTPNVSIAQASSTSSGFISDVHWNVFNEKQNFININTELTVNSITSNSQSGVVIKPYSDVSTKSGELLFEVGDGSGFIKVKSPATLGGTVNYTLPNSYGTSDQAITTDSAGNLFWSDIADGNEVETGLNSVTPISISGMNDLTISVVEADATTDGYLSLDDWDTFSGKQDKIEDSTDLIINSLQTDSSAGISLLSYGGGASETGEIHFKEVSGGNFVGFKAVGSTSSNVIWVLPSNAGTSGQSLITDGNKNLTWETVLDTSSITEPKFSSMGASVGHFIKWSGTDWIPSHISSLVYAGDWDATGPAPGVPTAGGYYYIVMTEGDTNLGGGPGTDDHWNVGDWAIYNFQESRWEKINNNEMGVASVTTTAPLTVSGSDPQEIGINKATTSTDGYLSVTDWITFNGKQELINNSDEFSLRSLTSSTQAGIVVAPYFDVASKAGELRFVESSGSNHVGFKAPSLSGNTTWTLPQNVGTDEQVLATDTNANLDWIDVVLPGEVISGIISNYPITSGGVGVINIGIDQADATNSGYLSSYDWDIFNTKQSSINESTDLTVNNLNTTPSEGLVIAPYHSGSTQAGELHFKETENSYSLALRSPSTLTGNVILTLPNSVGVSGQALTTDGSGNLYWSNLAIPSGVVTSVTATGPVESSGGNTPSISISQASSIDSGFLSSVDWNIFNNKQDAITPGLSTEYFKGDLTHGGFASETIATVLTGFSSTSGTISTVDTILGAINKLDGNLASKEDPIPAGTDSQYLSWNKSWQELDTNAVTEGGNLYYTSSRIQDDLIEISGITSGLTTKVPSSDAVYDALSIKQDYNSNLDTISSLSTAVDNIIMSNGSEWTVESIGTSANNVVKLNGDGRIPAVDGSQVFNIKEAVETKSANYNVSTSDSNKVFLVSNSTTLTLPSPASVGSNFGITVKNIDASNSVTVDATSNGGTIDGQGTVVLSSQYETLTLVCDGSSWYIINNK